MSTKAAGLAALLNRPLAIERGAAEAMIAALNARGDQLKPINAAARRRTERSDAPLGILPIVGPISYRPDILSWLFGGTSITELRDTLRGLLQAKHVDTIVALCDSPGGEVTGLEEFAYELREAGRVKPIIGVVDCLSASAAYWLLSQATEIVGTPSASVGSVGVLLLHVDHSGQLAEEGIRPTFISAGKYKTEGNHLQPLSDEALRHLQSQVDRYHNKFATDIARGRQRGLTADVVKRTFGEGRLLSAEDARRVGMIDRIFATTEAAFTYAGNDFGRRQVRAELDRMDWSLFERTDDAAERRTIAARIHARTAAVHRPAAGEIDPDVEDVTAALRRAESR